MPVIVTGTFILPDGGVAADRVITIRRARRDVVQQSGQVLVPDDVVIETDITGQVLFDLMPGNYVGFARTASGQSATFTMSVPDVETVDVSAIINADAVPDLPAPSIPSGEPGQILAYGANGQLTPISPQQASVSISADAANALEIGSDGGLYVFETITPDGGLDLTVLFDNQLI